MNRILIVEDESSISDFVKGELEYEGYEVCIKEDGRDGLEEALNNEYDLVILDIMLPSMNGFEICRRIKRVKATPVIMLSAKSSVIDKVNGLKLGADDYISKPFAIEELLARIEVVFRRESNPKDSIFKFKDITIDTKSRIVKRNNEEINLTNKEYEILLLLVIHKGWVLTYNQIYEKVWKDCPTGNERNTIGFHICNLREKLYQATPNAPFTIRSVREVGYCFEIQAEK